MLDKVKKLTDNYVQWLRSEITFKSIDEWVEISTPYLDRHNDYIQIYVKEDEDGSLYMTDDGYTLRDLLMCGVDVLKSDRRKAILDTTLNGFGIQLSNERELCINADDKNFPQRKHQLLQAIISVNDMFYLSRPNVTSLFFEDVIEWLSVNDIRGTRDINIIGKSGMSHKIDYSIPPSKKYNDRFLKIISKPDKSSIESCLFTYSEIQSVRDNFTPYVVLNDEDKNVKPEYIEALKNYSIKPVLWSSRVNFISELVA